MSDDRRTLIFGLDGGTWEVLNPLLEQGVMPRLQQLREQGAGGVLQSVVPVNSAAAWSSFLTGLPPEGHGVYDFFSWRPGSSRRATVNASWLPRPTIFDLMQDRGPLLALKVPLTYPAWPINGAMVSGLPTPDEESAFTHPRDLAARLNPLIRRHSGGRSWEVADDERHVILDQMEAAQESLERITGTLLERYSATRVACVVARDVDELQHFFWDALAGSNPQAVRDYQPRLHAYFRRLDDYLGRWLDWAGPTARVVLLSDHGFGPIEALWHVNEWLRAKGFLRLQAAVEDRRQASGHLPLPRRLEYALVRRLLRGVNALGIKGEALHRALERLKLQSLSSADLGGIDWNSTLAYAGNVGEEWVPIYINLQGREPQGIVEPEQYHRVRDDLRRTLLKSAQPQVKAVHRAEEIFRLADSRLASAPDLLVETPGGGVQSDFVLGSRLVTEPPCYRKACHRRAGMFLLHGPEVEPAQGDASLLDIPATILAWLGLPVPDYFAGRPLNQFIAGLPGERTPGQTPHTVAAERAFLSLDEEDGVRQKLESLGYM
ncbi:MAG: hypothetical protein C4524_09830 [Candidatus Zixiibacteriota bacterium]|nr:MAG: hypothetical protein C4524_09830 [candidate division Zixibacteria bacterium]